MRGCCTYGNICKNPHSARDLVESEVSQSRMTKWENIVFFADESGTIKRKDLEDVTIRQGQCVKVDMQERGFGQPGTMFKVTVTPHCTQRKLRKMLFNSETLLVRGLELKKLAWCNLNKGRKEESERPSWFDQARIDLRDKIRNKQLGGEANLSLNNGVKREQEEWQENLDHSRKRVKVEVKTEVKEEVDDGTISDVKQERGNQNP